MPRRPVPVPSGAAYRVESPPHHGLVTPDLARALARVLERFAREAGFTPAAPVGVEFRPGTVGHHRLHRAADIYGVGGRGLAGWKRRWDRARAEARRHTVPEARRARMARERRTNLGWRLYRALTCYGRWAQPYGYPIQLFGPWTREAGPWHYISERLLSAHRDHIHIAL